MPLDNAAAFADTDPFGTPPAARTTPVEEPDVQADKVDGSDGGLQSTTPAGAATPFYKKRWFLVSQVVAIVGIGLLFVLLYSVVKAIVQHIVNVSQLNIDRVAVVRPTNTS
jgi:hypothetical protein